jgi:hypothetical protein
MSIDAFILAYSRFTALGGCTTTSLYLICSTACKQNSYDFFGVLTTSAVARIRPVAKMDTNVEESETTTDDTDDTDVEK